MYFSCSSVRTAWRWTCALTGTCRCRAWIKIKANYCTGCVIGCLHFLENITEGCANLKNWNLFYNFWPEKKLTELADGPTVYVSCQGAVDMFCLVRQSAIAIAVQVRSWPSAWKFHRLETNIDRVKWQLRLWISSAGYWTWLQLIHTLKKGTKQGKKQAISRVIMFYYFAINDVSAITFSCWDVCVSARSRIVW